MATYLRRNPKPSSAPKAEPQPKPKPKRVPKGLQPLPAYSARNPKNPVD